MMEFKPKCLATAIGSLPHDSAEAAVDVVLKSIPDAPIWPQVSARGLLEQMEIQYSEGMPCAIVDKEKGRLYFDTSVDYSEPFAEFYEAYMMAMDEDDGNGDCSAMAISPDYSAGIYALEEKVKATGKKLPFIKVQVTGPVSFALTVVDENKRAMYYNEEFRDMIVKAIAMKARWQIQKFKPYAENIICFIDEPILSAFGSSTYVSVQREDVVAILEETIAAVHADGAFAGIHCCGNTEWSILMDAGVDLVNFDAFEFGDTIAMYPDHVKKHLEAGRALAWGVVPTSEVIREQTVESLVAKYEEGVANLIDKTGLDKQLILEQTVITPSCGTGSMAVEDAEKVFEMDGKVSAALKEKYG
ncbi:MAG: uroporphyrinogen decarboxylase/cobalamine-independent methonine synthase family protein, partial [Planctomycetota bacterium]